MKYYLIILGICITFCKGYGQEIPAEYEHLITLDIPTGIKNAIPGELTIDTTHQLLAIEYGYKPTTIDIYQIGDWNNYKRIKVKGWVYQYRSYFSKDGKYLYLAVGRNKKYLEVNLASLEQRKIKCHLLPRGCDIDYDLNHESRYGNDPFYIMGINEQYVTLYDLETTKIYLKKKTNH